MRILFVSNYPHLPEIHGGLQTTTHDLCLTIKTMGGEASVLCGQSLDAGATAPPLRTDYDLGYPVTRAADPEELLPEIASNWRADVIVVQTGTSLLPMVIRSLSTGRPTAVYLHNVETHQLAGTLVADPALRYFANSDFTAQRWHSLSNIDCCVIPPIVDPAQYLADGTGEQVLFVNPTPIKGVEIMFALAAACPELPFLVYESWNLAPTWREYCRARARSLGNIHWCPPTSDMREAYSQAKVLLMPSIWEESFGRTVIEAQLNGLPVLASNRGALPALVGNGGMTLDPHAPIADWAQALREIYTTAAQRSHQARQLGVSHVAATPLIVGQLLTELALHICAAQARQ
ncbi:glycosyl transferase family 1 [Azospira sp. I13]|uniref:glycosyltransferase n=1 Tax=Azospira sp. I13 TaxID=1765050 RepID=UPI000D45E5E7|nr:glycosyltransferase [Azospira sp. I13]GBG01565.1 glycosyl transferase family 1 [Azospira sp. I13]